MFEPSSKPRLFALPPGADFAEELVRGLKSRLAGQPPEAMAKVELILNTRRMQRRIETIFDSHGAGFLPRIRLITDIADPVDLARLPKPVPALRRQLELAELVKGLIAADPSIAPRSAVYDLAQSLNALLDEMQAEGVAPDDIRALDVTDQSGHWERALRFLNIVTQYVDPDPESPDAATVKRLALEQRLQRWTHTPPDHPVIVAGSTGSRGLAFRLMTAVSRLPNGAVVLPGFDVDMPDHVWDTLRGDVKNTEAMQGEDHPQFRFARLMETLDIRNSDVAAWTDTPPPCPERNALVSLSLRPAPVTDQWLEDGPRLPSLENAIQSLTLLEAPHPRDEARAIALRLRHAAEDGVTAALITPDRMLTRRVTAMLDRWNILPDDSAGTPAQLTAPGRFLRHVVRMQAQGPTAEALLTILKNPLCHSGADRGQHLLWTAELELFIRDKGVPYPTLNRLKVWKKAEEAADWLGWIEAHLLQPSTDGSKGLSDHISHHLHHAEAICAGSTSEDASELWAKEAGKTCRSVCDTLLENAGFGGRMSVTDYADLFDTVLRGEEVRDRDAPHPRILIWGTIEARVMGADLVILGGLNEQVWPSVPAADPWLNRRLRQQAGLLLPERRIGLSAHDFQQAIGAKEVWLTRAERSDDAETVPSRWLNRLTNLMHGLPGQGGREALKHMKARGDHWLDLGKALEEPMHQPLARRPSPVPPVIARPTELSVTNIERLIRDPYAIYASKVLRLRMLNPIQHMPNPMARGILIHSVFEKFVSNTAKNPDAVTLDHLLETAKTVLDDTVPWPADRVQWRIRIEKIARWFIENERARRRDSQPVLFEKTGAIDLANAPFRVTAKADRIDINTLGQALVYDYKTGTAPSQERQKAFDVQLLVTAALVVEGGFKDISPRGVADARYISLSGEGNEVPAPLADCPPERVLAMLETLIAAYRDPDMGYTARNKMHKDSFGSDYDQLSRFGEWDVSDTAQKVFLS
ncbi:double-strand break repair protein AddB [Marivita hallyeonensis]|uniref:Double-strand break repair protein AddB n=1 Tax=Marivita hallyeonensis TaxID=996342 RepID=A0A1M5U9C4_9RHOB|nr:double-strand break repair protein AddB [Marivita hallyeonensis]SHH59632.1 double-strand break repair protein AddB [Marivita hallyeonensis]